MVAGFGWIDLSPHGKLTGFTDEIRAGRLVKSRCRACGEMSFPPRADCARCRSGEFELVAAEPRGTLVTYTRIDAAPAGFEDKAPYTLGVVELNEGGRLLACFGDSIVTRQIEIGMKVDVVCQLVDGKQGPRALYTLEQAGSAAPGTTHEGGDRG